MALSGAQVTQHGISGYTQITYSSFAGKTEQVLPTNVYSDLIQSLVSDLVQDLIR